MVLIWCYFNLALLVGCHGIRGKIADHYHVEIKPSLETKELGIFSVFGPTPSCTRTLTTLVHTYYRKENKHYSVVDLCTTKYSTSMNIITHAYNLKK